jgi:hypothetical protein
LPLRSASTASPPFGGGPGNLGEVGISEWLEKGYRFDRDAKWSY